MRVWILLAALLAFRAYPHDLEGHWAQGRIFALADRGILRPDPDGHFRPSAPLSRGTFLRWLVTAKGLPLERQEPPPFPDLPPSLAPYVGAAFAHGILNERGLFRPYAPVTRQDAVLWTVRALGYAREAAFATHLPLPFADADRIPPPHRGAVAVAVLSRPPLLREPPAPHFRPLDPMTRAEGASLVWAYLQAVEGGIRWRFQFPLGPAVLVTVEKRGALRTLPVWRVQIGAFASAENAQRLAREVRSRGLPVFIDFLDGLYKVRVGSSPTRAQAEALSARLTEEGYPTWVISTLRDFESLPGPHWIAHVRIPPGTARLRVALAGDQVLGRERTSVIARRAGAIAAVNGGYFAPDGDPIGGVMVDGEWVSEPLPGRPCLGITASGEALIDALHWRAEALTPAGSLPVAGLNRRRGANELVLYTPRYGPTTPPQAMGVEVVVDGGTVQEVHEGSRIRIPPNGFVLSGQGASSSPLRSLRLGDPVQVWISVQPASGDGRWQQVREVVCGGPRLLARGQVVTAREGFSDGFLLRRHPRTAVGVALDGTVILLVVDGRAPEHSLGMTIPELARELWRLGAADALNLDGGGSTTLVANGRVLNQPSDETGERPVSDALLVLPP